MTRKDYILIAEAVRKGGTKGEIIDNLCSQLKSDNGRFDKERFRVACWEKLTTDGEVTS